MPKFNPRRLPRWMLGAALPAMLGACAQHASPPPVKQASSEFRVFHVGPSREGQRRLDTYADNLPELSSAFSTAEIIENILSRGRAAAASRLKIHPPKGQPTPPPSLARAPLPSMASVKVIARPTGKKSHARDHWARLRDGLILSSVEHEAVTAQLESLRSHPGAVNFLMKRAAPYAQYLLEEIDRHGLPADLMLVPMVESAFEPTALSPKQAAGMWQFIPSTGAQYGLQQVEGYDGRYDVHASTQAALKYLKHLSALFHGDWLLALAAYNAGEGAVGRAVEANRKTGGTGSFWELSLPAETQAYVLKILALAHAVADPASCGVKPHKSAPAPYLARVQVGPEVRIADLVASAGIVPEEFYRLNPAFKPDLPPPPGHYQLLMPLDKAENLAGHIAGAKVLAMRTVVVKKGETLSILAKRHGVPEPKLAEWNGLKPKAALKAGQELVVFPV